MFVHILFKICQIKKHDFYLLQSVLMRSHNPWVYDPICPRFCYVTGTN